MKFIIIIISAFIVCSCRLILGIKDPKPKTAKQLDSYLVKNHFDTTHCFAFTSTAFDSIQKTSFKPKWPVGFRPLQFKAFDASGRMVSQYASCEGSFKKRNVFNAYPPHNLWPLDTSVMYSQDIQMYREYDGRVINLPVSSYDLSIVVYWGTWLGRYNKSLLKAVFTYKKNNPEKKINILLVNVDEIFSPKK